MLYYCYDGVDCFAWEGVLSLSNVSMSKQDTVALGLRVHLHQQGSGWGLDGVLILAGLKPINFSNVDEYSFGGMLKCGWKRFVSAGLLFGILRIHVPHCFYAIMFQELIYDIHIRRHPWQFRSFCAVL